MNKKTIIIIILAGLISTNFVFSQEQEQNLPNPGLLPDSPFYFLKIIGEGTKTFFTFGDVNKTERHLYLTEKRLAEVQALIEKQVKPELIKKTLKRYQDRLRKVEEYHQKVKAKEPKPELEEKISEKLLNHQEVLLRVLNKAPEQAREGIENAIEKSRQGFEQAVESVSKDKKEKLREEFRHISEKITRCGNGICEKEESAQCPRCVYDPINPCKVRCTEGTCPSDCEISELNVPYSFFVVHIKGHLSSEEFNSQFNAYLKPLVESADRYNVKATLQFSPQWVDWILANNNVLDIVHSWQKNGHEIGMVHPGPSHMNWHGYTNLPKGIAENISYIRGTSDALHKYIGSVDEFFEKVKKLSYPQEVKSAGMTNKWTDVPQEILYLAEGGGNGRTRMAIKNVWSGHTTYRLNIQGLWDRELLEITKNDYKTLTEDEIFGVVTHHHNFVDGGITPEGKQSIEKWFQYLYETDPEGNKRKTLTWIMDNYVLPNNLVVEGGCGDSLCDDIERETGSCQKDCANCAFPSNCGWCTNSRECPECSNMRVCEQGIDNTIYEFVF